MSGALGPLPLPVWQSMQNFSEWHIAQYAGSFTACFLCLPLANFFVWFCGLELEVLRVARVALLGGDLPAARVLQAVAAIARQHVGRLHAEGRVRELLVAGLTGVVANEVIRVSEDQLTGHEGVEVRVAVDALRHRHGAIGVDLDRRALGLGIDDRVIDVGHLGHLGRLFRVTLIAVLGPRVTHHASVDALRVARNRMGLLRPVVAVVLGPQVERLGVAVLARACCQLSLGTVLHPVTREADLHGDSLGDAVLVRQPRVAAVAAHQKVVAVAELQSGDVHRTEVEVALRALLAVHRRRGVDDGLLGSIADRGRRK